MILILNQFYCFPTRLSAENVTRVLIEMNSTRRMLDLIQNIISSYDSVCRMLLSEMQEQSVALHAIRRRRGRSFRGGCDGTPGPMPAIPA